MAKNSRVILYGNSVFLAGIKAQLEHIPSLKLISMEAAPSDVADWICVRHPKAVLFDLTMGYPDFVIALLHEQPGLLLIGVNPNSNKLLILSGQQVRAETTTDLVRLLSDSHE